MKISSAAGALCLAACFALACSRENNVQVQGSAGAAGGPGAAGSAGKSGGSTGSAGTAGTSSSLGKPCSSKAECPDGACVAGLCRPSCTTDVDCDAKSICLSDGVASGCRAPDEATCTGTCSNQALVCGLDGSCRTPCTDKCGRDGVSCIRGACVGQLEPGASDTWFSCQASSGYVGMFCGGADGATLSACNGDKPGVAALDTCANAALCNDAAAKGAKTCTPAACAATDLQCGGKDKATLQRCRADRTGFEDVPDRTCVTAALCALAKDASTAQTVAPCPPPVCDAGAGQCAGGKALACNAGRTGYDAVQTCVAPTAACVPASATCVHLGVDATEVTREAYAKFLADVVSKGAPQQPAACASNVDFTPQFAWSPSDQAMKTLPVSGVDWCDAYAYCKAQSKRLCGRIGGTTLPKAEFSDPSKSQWMNACTSGGQFTHTFGAWQGLSSQDTCNGAGNWQTGQTPAAVPVGSLSGCASSAAGYAGVFDLTGNVAEWEDSCDGTPEAGTKGDACHVRGGSFDDELQGALACAADRTLARNATAANVGFRCCDP